MQTQKNTSAQHKTDCHAVHFYALPETALLVQELLENTNTVMTFPKPRTKWARLSVFTETESDARKVAAQFCQWLAGLPKGSGRVRLERILPDDWQESWKRHFPTLKISPRIIVRPAWKPPRLYPGKTVVRLNPGLSFGTGLHPTTRSCLKILDDLTLKTKGSSFLDLGCGSGILAIAASYLGCRPVTALDHDPQAVRAARENTSLNRLEHLIFCKEADLFALTDTQPHQLVAANLLAEILIEASERITNLTQDYLIISGILAFQYPSVRLAFEKRGFREERLLADDEWHTGGFVRR